MTPEERQWVNELFDRLAGLETAPRDAEAEQVIAEGLKRAPNAVYALVQTVLVQDEALRRADARIRELTGTQAPAPTQGGFLDNMRALLGGGQRGSVPSVRPGAAGGDPAYVGAAPASGGSFLGTAAASAAGVIGGALLLNTISSMFGHHASAYAAPSSASPGAGGGQGENAFNALDADEGVDSPAEDADFIDDADGSDFGDDGSIDV
jgi:hypothetical protein